MIRETNRINKLIKLLFFVIPVSILLSACQDISKDDLNSEGLSISGSIVLPELQDAVSRGVIGDTPKANLKLTIFEFDLGADASHSFLSNIYNAEITSPTNVGNNGIVNFKFTLKAANTPKVLHLFIADTYLTADFGSIASILPTLIVGAQNNEYEAYWGRVEFEDGFSDVSDAEGVPQLLPYVKQRLTKVPVIRNFAKISVVVGSAENPVTNFELLGFDLINVPTSGTVAPWNQSTLSVPDLLDGNAMKPFSEIKDSYAGIVPYEASFRNVESDAKNWNSTSAGMHQNAKYIYEHPYESTRRTYLIVYGKYTDTHGKSTFGFYKLDIGTRKADGSFEYYNIIRNYNYIVRITDVLAAGTATVAEAIARAPFNNLISATETSSMLNVSNGQNMLIVNDTNHIIVNDEATVDILYRYIKDVTGSKAPATAADYNDISVLGLEKGAVIDSWTKDSFTDGNGIYWMRIKIKTNNPTINVRTQSITIVDKDGLGRTIHLILRKPWQYAKIGDTNYTATIAPGTRNLYTNPNPQAISSKAQQPATVYFNLPNGLPESMFPLDFTLESENQGLENHKSDNLVVSYGQSLFNPDVTSIQYVKTVTYQEYMHPYKNDGSNDVNLSVNNTNHTIRCRFLTITEGTADGEVRIHNEYFSPDASVKFQRSSSVPLQ